MRKRRYFLGLLSGGVILSATRLNSVSDLGDVFSKKKSDGVMPSLFLGHGSPMNAIETNAFTRTLNSLGDKLPAPAAILCVSAHWMTEGTWITEMEYPKTIHDFSGFPQQLFAVRYPAPGRPDLAQSIQKNISSVQIKSDKSEWGLDHGTWSVLRHMYPKADVPVMQLSLDMTQPPDYHFKLGEELHKLREQGILIVGSGNIVHNLRQIRWEDHAAPFDWALQFDEWSKRKLVERDFKALQNDFLKTEAGRLSVPTPDHYLPLLYVIGASRSRDTLKFEFEDIHLGSISMRCLSFSRT